MLDPCHLQAGKLPLHIFRTLGRVTGFGAEQRNGHPLARRSGAEQREKVGAVYVVLQNRSVYSCRQLHPRSVGIHTIGAFQYLAVLTVARRHIDTVRVDEKHIAMHALFGILHD